LFIFQNRDDLKRIHQDSLAILEETGLVIHDQTSREPLRLHGFKVDKWKAYFQADLVLELIGQAPGEIDLKALNPERNLYFGRKEGHQCSRRAQGHQPAHPTGGHMATPDEVAVTVTFLASDLAGHITRQPLLVDGGETKAL